MVAKAIHVPTQQHVAVKRVVGLFNNTKETICNLREILVLLQAKHKNIVKLVDVIVTQDIETFDTIYLVIELGRTDLATLLDTMMFLNMRQITKIVYQMVCGIKYLHAHDIVHRDLKPANVI